MKIDAHQHFWVFDPVRDSWITDDMKVIQNDFLPQHLQPVLKQNGIDGCVAVQSVQLEEHNDFLLLHATENDFIKGVVGWVDLMSDDIDSKLAHYSKQPKLKGFRHVLQGEPKRDYMLQPAFLNGIGALSKYGFTYDILIFTDQLQYVPQFVAHFPNQPFVIDHIAKPDIKAGRIDNWEEGIRKAASFENVYCKISGMVTEADWSHWKKDDFTKYLDVVTEAFGTDRLMFGSDWPVCLVAASYQSMLDIVQSYYSNFSEAEKANIFGGNATRFYNL